MRLKPYITYLIILIILLSFEGVSLGMERRVQFQKEVWEQLPLRSHAQKEAGLTGGEGMQMIYDIAYAHSNPDVVYLISNTSQVWKSIDGGNYWQMKHRGFLSKGGISLAVDPVNENIVIAAGSLCKAKKPFISSPADGIYLTRDGGENWSMVKKTPFFGEVIDGQHFAFALNTKETQKTDVIYAGTHKDGLLISKDGGDSWRSIGFENEKILDIKLDPVDSSILYLLTVKSFYKISLRNYLIFKVKKIGEDLNGSFKTFALDIKDPSIMYIAMGYKGVYKSIDGGKNFSRRMNGLPENKNYTHISISPVNSDYLYLSINKSDKINPFWSHDGGETWHMPSTLDSHNDSLIKGKYFSSKISPHPLDNNIALTSTNGMARVIKTLSGGVNWFYSGNGYTGGRKPEGKTSHAFYSDPKKMVLFLMDFGPALTIDGGETFELLDIPKVFGLKTTRVGAVSLNNDNIIVTAIGSWDKQRLAVSWNNGRSWKLFRGTEDKYKFISFHPQKTNIIYAYGFISMDNGRSWGEMTQKVYGIFKNNGDIIYSIKNIDRFKSVIVRSNDQGKVWTDIYPALPFRSEDILEIDIDPLNADRIYIASLHGLYIYDNNKREWLKKGEKSGLEKDRFGLLSIRNVAVDTRHPEVVYVSKVAYGKGHSNGIFRSVDYGVTWENITYNLGPEFTAQSISISPHDGRVFIGSSHGTWILPPPY